MAWYSLLPPQLIYFESWAVRVFFLLGLITILPWAALIIFDAVYYLYRLILWELPWIGGRARGHERPRARSSQGRSEDQPWTFTLSGVGTDPRDDDSETSGTASSRTPVQDEPDGGREDVTRDADGNPHPSVSDGGVKRRVTANA